MRGLGYWVVGLHLGHPEAPVPTPCRLQLSCESHSGGLDRPWRSWSHSTGPVIRALSPSQRSSDCFHPTGALYRLLIRAAQHTRSPTAVPMPGRLQPQATMILLCCERGKGQQPSLLWDPPGPCGDEFSLCYWGCLHSV